MILCYSRTDKIWNIDQLPTISSLSCILRSPGYFLLFLLFWELHSIVLWFFFVTGYDRWGLYVCSASSKPLCGKRFWVRTQKYFGMRIFRKLNETKSNRSNFWVSLPTLQTFLKPPLFILIPNLLKNNGAVLKKRTPLIRGSPSLRSVLFTHYVLPWSRNIMQMIQYVLFLNLSDRPCQPLYTATPFEVSQLPKITECSTSLTSQDRHPTFPQSFQIDVCIPPISLATTGQRQTRP